VERPDHRCGNGKPGKLVNSRDRFAIPPSLTPASTSSRIRRIPSRWSSKTHGIGDAGVARIGKIVTLEELDLFRLKVTTRFGPAQQLVNLRA
jgi:hypothetical protein